MNSDQHRRWHEHREEDGKRASTSCEDIRRANVALAGLLALGFSPISLGVLNPARPVATSQRHLLANLILFIRVVIALVVILLPLVAWQATVLVGKRWWPGSVKNVFVEEGLYSAAVSAFQQVHFWHALAGHEVSARHLSWLPCNLRRRP